MEAKITILSLTLSLLLWRNVRSMPQIYGSGWSSGGGSATACCTINGVYRCYQSGSSGFVNCGGGTNGVSYSPSISIPKFVIPTMPTFKIPSFTIPSFNIPSFSGFGSSGGGSSTACCTVNGVYRCYQSGSSGFATCGGKNEGDNDEETEDSNGDSSAGDVGESGGSSTACCTIDGVYRCFQSGTSGSVACSGGDEGSQNIAVPSFTFPTIPSFTIPSFTFPTIPTFAGGGSGSGGSGTACCTVNGVTKCYQSGSSGYASCGGQ